MGLIKFGYQDYQCELLRGDLYIPRGRYKGEKEILQNYDISATATWGEAIVEAYMSDVMQP